MSKEFNLGEGPEFQSLNSTTAYLGKYYCQTIDNLLWSVPGKIGTRLRLIDSGLNSLPTLIIDPSEVLNFSGESLRPVLQMLNNMNRDLGFPETSDLIIRTAKVSNSFNKINSGVRISEPALLATSVDKGPKFKLLSDTGTGSNLQSVKEFVKRFAEHSTFLLIHPDDYGLQMKSMHGRLLKFDAGSELACASRVLHARDLLERKIDAPLVRINAEYFEDIFDIDPAADGLTVRNMLGRPEICVLNSNWERESYLLLRQIRANSHLIIDAYTRAVSIFGANAVMEFRLYPSIPEGIGRNFQVLDVNKKF